MKTQRANSAYRFDRVVLTAVFGFMFLLLEAGCGTTDPPWLTKELWTNDRWKSYREPAMTPRLEVFRRDRPPDYLICFDAQNEGGGSLRRHAYFARENQRRIERSEKPRFVPLAAARDLEPVSLEPREGAAVQILTTNKEQTLIVIENGREVERFPLPVYERKTSYIAPILGTPVTLAVDTTIAFFWAGICWIPYVVP